MKLTNNLFDRVVEAAPCGMIMIDEAGLILMVNLFTEKLFGYKREELLNQSIEILVPDRSKGMHPHMRTVFFKSPQTRSMGAGRELFGKRKDGTEIPIEIGLNPLEFDGKMVVLASVIDITERKKNEQLVASREAALEASRLKSQFLANMSHEIRTPLNGIIGLTNLLFSMEASEEQKEHLRGIRVSADALLELINDILDLSKIEADKMEIEIVNFNLSQMIADCVSVTASAAKAKSLALKIELDAKIPEWMKGDISKIKQVVINLIGNAIKFTEKGGITVRAFVVEDRNASFVIEFQVIDTGIGMNEEVRSRLFEAFNQGDNSTRRKYGGTGLGLSISKKLVQKMGGVLDVESSSGKGSKFWFRLPLEEGVPVELEKKGRKSKEVSLGALKGFRILVAEDNMINQKVALGALKNLGVQGQAVGNGIEVLQILKDFKFDLIMMDCHMPDMDGFESTQAIRALPDPDLKNIPIIAMTANVMQGDRERCLKAGMNDYISKPFVEEDLENILSKWLVGGGGKSAVEFQATQANSIHEIMVKIQSNYGADMAKELVKIFLETTPTTISRLLEYYDANDLHRLKVESHALKSSSLIFGLKEFSDTAASIERSCGEPVTSGIPSQLESLKNLFEKYAPMLKDFL